MRLVLSWVGVGKGLQRMQSLPGGKSLETTKAFKYFVLLNPCNGPEEGILWLLFTNGKTQAQRIFTSEWQRQS